MWELSTQDTRRLVSGPNAALVSKATLSPAAQRLLDVAVQYRQEKGAPINMTRAAEALQITSMRTFKQLVEELERAGLIRTRKLRQKGQPRIIEPVSSRGAE